MRPRAGWLIAVGLMAASGSSGCSETPSIQPEEKEAASSTSTRLPDVIVITWDTVRADHVSAPADGRESHTPRWDRLAAAGVRFAAARTVSPITLPAHASLMTGLAPPHHGARDNGLFEVREGVSTLAADFSRAGYATGAFVSAEVLARRYGLDRGFDHYDDDLLEAGAEGRSMDSRIAEQTVSRALAWLRGVDRERPIFAWLHLFDPHAAWVAPAHFADRFDPYRAEIAYTDAQTAVFLEVLAARRGLERTVVVLTSDHGESLGEHGEPTHGFFAYDSTLRIPLLIWAGSESGLTVEPGLVVDDPVSLLDIAPTLRAATGLPAKPSEGRSLLGALVGEALPPLAFPFETLGPANSYGAAPIFGVLTEAGEVWLDVPRRERYDLASDPGQLRNLYTEADGERADALFARYPRDWPPPNRRALEDEVEQRLARLGYLFDPPAALATDAPLPDPKDRIRLHAALGRDSTRRNPRRFLEELQALRAEFGLSALVTRFEVDALASLGRSAEALALIRRLGEAFPEHNHVRQVLAEHAEAERQLRARLNAIEAAADERPSRGTRRALAVTHHQLQQVDEALEGYAALLAEDPHDWVVRFNRASLLVGLERDSDATVDLDALIRGDNDPERLCRAGHLLGWILEDVERGRAAYTRCREAGGELDFIGKRVVAGIGPEP